MKGMLEPGVERGRGLALCLGLILTCALLLPEGCGRRQTVQEQAGQPVSGALQIPEYTNYWSHTELPEMTNQERLDLAEQNRARGEDFVEEMNGRARALSDDLEDYIRRWLRGEAPAELPEGLLPPYVDTPKTADWTLRRPEEVRAEDQWLVIPAHANDPSFQACYMLGTDPNVTYGKLIFTAPIGSRLLVEGDFPHSRYFEYEILPPFDPQYPATGTMGETPEVPLVDADIEPDAGSANPFRVGADRNADPRHYNLSFDLALGNAVDLNPQAMQTPGYRGPGNGRTGGPFGFAGAWGGNVITPSILWMRIYAPDRDVDVYGGVGLPRAMLELSTGERFWLQCDFSVAEERENTRVSAGSDTPREPFAAIGPELGWHKLFGLALGRMETLGYFQTELEGKPEGAVKERIRRDFLLVFNRGEDAEPPGDYEGSSTACKNNTFLTRMLQMGPGKVYVITGRMPDFPETRGGEAVMTGGEIRYWSISQYGKGEGDQYETAVNYWTVMDDEVVLNENGDYVIVYSTAQDRPANATPENGVTWVDWGPRSRQTLTIRWMSVIPEWHLPQYSPDQGNLPWATAAWSGTRYDETLIGLNQPGAMGPYHPVIHYLSTGEFESLGDQRLSPKDIPAWK